MLNKKNTKKDMLKEVTKDFNYLLDRLKQSEKLNERVRVNTGSDLVFIDLNSSDLLIFIRNAPKGKQFLELDFCNYDYIRVTLTYLTDSQLADLDTHWLLEELKEKRQGSYLIARMFEALEYAKERNKVKDIKEKLYGEYLDKLAKEQENEKEKILFINNI